MARWSLRARKAPADEPSDRRSAQKRKNGEAESSGTPKQKKKKSEKEPLSERKGRTGRPPRIKKETPPSTPSSTKGTRGSARKSRGGGKKRKDKFQMVLEDDYDKDYIDYESPEEEIQEAEEEDVLEMEASQEDEETPEEDTNIDITPDSDSETEAGHSSRCPSEIDEMSMEPLEIWRDNSRHFPELDLPESSLDLLLPPNRLLLDALETYETLRHFSPALKLTVAKFECFLTAIVHKEHSAMLSHTFLVLLKTLYKSDDRSGIVYGPADSRDGAYSLYAFADLLTWPFALKAYAQSDPVHFGDLDLQKIGNLPFEPSAEKIKALKAILSAVVDCDIIRNFIERGRTDHTGEETCRSCQQKGQLVLCDMCPAGYHPHCANIKDTDKLDQISFECSICVQNKISLVHDCIPAAEAAEPKYIRHEILGYDRHGRKYWYLVRRIWVESLKEDKCWYYSTPHQLEELINALDSADYESSLVSKLEEMKQEITTAMDKTIAATKNVGPQTPIRQVKPQSFFDFIDVSSDGVLKQPTCKFAPGTPTNEEFPEHAKIETTFRLGLERLVYTNFYHENRLAMNKRELKEIKDFEGKLYAMEYAGNWDRQKFVRPENINRILWSNNKAAGLGIMDRIIRELVDTMRKLSEAIAKWFFHPDWIQKRVDWRQKLVQCRDIKELARLLEVFEVHLRPCMKRTIWFDCIGQTSFARISTKEDQKGSEARKQRDKKLRVDESKAEEKRNAYRETLHNPFVHYNRNKEQLITNRTMKLSMVKGEEYRYDRGFSGWYWRSKTYRSMRKKAKSEDNSESESSENQSNPAKKDLKVDKLLELREHMEEVAKIENTIKEEAEEKKKMEAEVKEEEKKQTEKDMDDILSSVLETAAAESERIADEITPRKAENGEEIKQEPAADEKPKEPEEPTAQPVKLKKRVVTQIPEVTSVHVKKFSSRGVLSLFRYSYGRKRMARTGGCVPCAKGFNYTAKSHRSNEVWPYPAPKPAYHVIWKYRLAECDDVYTLAHLLSIFIRMLKWDLVVERPPFVDGDKLIWTDTSDDENITYEIKNKRFLAGSARLRMEYELKQTIQPADSEEIIPKRDQRAVEAIARSGRRLRQLKNADDYSRNEPSESVAWINEERMKIWQVDLFHRVTEENGINATRSTTYERGGSLRDRSSIRPREVLDPSPDYTPEKNIPTRARPHSDNQYREATVSNSILDSRNKFLPSRPARIIRPPDQMTNQQTYTPYRGPPRQQQQSPSATNVRITKHVLERILHNPTFFTQINYDKPPEHCQYLKISEPTDLTLFPGGKNYQTKISNELKQIYSYTPGSYEKYQEMIKTKKVLKFAPEAPAKPKTPPPPPNQSVQRPPQQNGPKTVPHVSINGQLHQVFHLYDKTTGMTFKAIKRPGGEGFQAIGQSFNMANGNSGQQQMVTNGNQQQQFTQNSMNGAPVQMSQPIVIQQPQAQQIHIQNAPQQRQQQHQQQYQQQQQVQIQQPQQQMGSTMVINNTSSISSNGDNNDNGNNAYITSEVHLSNEARNSLEMQKKVIKTQIHQTRRQMVQSFMPRPVYQSPIAANSPKPVQVLMNANYQPVKTRPPTLQRKVAPSPLSLTGQKFCVCKATFDQETQYGDIQCDLCQQPFHATCVGASPTEQFTCSPCHQKHTSARSTCICHSFDGKNGLLADRNAELNWCSCDVCQTWFHENCVSSEKTFVRLPNKDEISFMCTKCSQADLEIVNGPMTLSKLQLTEQIYSKFKNSRHSWPLKRKDIVCRIQTNMGFIESKLNQKLYKTFKQFMDEVFYCINFFREHYASTSAPESSFSNAKKEVKCCEILEYDFSYLIREFIAKERHKSAFVILPESHANIEENERAINAGMSSGAAANIFP